MKKPAAALFFLLLVFVVAVAGARLSCAISCWMQPPHQDGHDWIHTQLGLTPQQVAALETIEKPYHEKRQGFERGLAEGNRELAEAIRADGGDSDRVQAAIGKIHANMGELQMLTIGHVFQMKEILSPEQYQKLLNFTADALNNLDSRHGGE
jgi:Spy/CpxP family protein refolding chaperone